MSCSPSANDLAVDGQLDDHLHGLRGLLSRVVHLGGEVALASDDPHLADLFDRQARRFACLDPQHDDRAGKTEKDGSRGREGRSLGCHSQTAGRHIASLPAAPPMAAGNPRSTTWSRTSGHGSPGWRLPKNSSIATEATRAIK